MITRSIPAADVLVAHEQAAQEICELRRRGIHCHLEEHADSGGHYLDVVQDCRADLAATVAQGEDR